MLQFDDDARGLLGQNPHGVLVSQPVAALDGVVVVPMPIVFFLVAQTGCNAAFC